MRLARAILFAVPMAGLPAIGFGGQLEEAVLACRDVADQRERVRCYDLAVDRQVAVEETDQADHVSINSPVPGSTPSVSAEELFGKSPADAQRALEEASGTEPIDRIEATITEIQTIAPKRIAVRLDNGQVWKQTDTSTLRVKEGDEIMIRRRSLGSHTLQKQGRATSMRVARVY